MYECKMCNRVFDDEPALRNVCGPFCAECKAKIHERAGEATRRRFRLDDGRCIWCRELLTSENRQVGTGADEAVCIKCMALRRWMLTAIRASAHPAEYVARVEQRERPGREQREREAQEQQKHTPQLDFGAGDQQSKRIDRIENILEKVVAMMEAKHE